MLAHFTLRQCGPSLIIALDHRAPSCAVWCATEPYQKHCLLCPFLCPLAIHKYHHPLVLGELHDGVGDSNRKTILGRG